MGINLACINDGATAVRKSKSVRREFQQEPSVRIPKGQSSLTLACWTLPAQ